MIGRRLVASQSVPSQLSRMDQAEPRTIKYFRKPVHHMSSTVNYETHSTNTLVDGDHFLYLILTYIKHLQMRNSNFNFRFTCWFCRFSSKFLCLNSSCFSVF